MSEQGPLSKYKPEYDEQIIELVKRPMNLYLVAAEWGVCRDTLNEWTKVHPSFSDAYARAKTIRAGLLLERVEIGMSDREFNAPAAKLVLSQEEQMSLRRRIKIDGISKGTLSDKANRVLEEVEEARISPDEALSLMHSISQATKIEEITNVREELNTIKEKMAEKK